MTCSYKQHEVQSMNFLLPSSLNEQHGYHVGMKLLLRFGKSMNIFLSLCELFQLLNNVYEDLHQQHFQEEGYTII